MNYRRNANGLNKEDHIHLDVPSGGNCVMTFKDGGSGYYGIRFESRYIDTSEDDSSTGQWIHQWSEDLSRDNQKFKFIPVEGEPDTYYIQSKKGNIYVGLKDNKAAQHTPLKTVDSNHKCKWVVVPTDRVPFPTDKSETFDTSKQYYLWLKEGDTCTYDYRWNANGTGWKDEIHLDIPAGANCKFTFKDMGNNYYAIRFDKRYVDMKDNLQQLGRILWQWEDDPNQANRNFRFIPVEGEPNTYYIQIKRNGLYVGLEGFQAAERYRNLACVDADHACKWEVISTDMTQLESNAKLPGARERPAQPYPRGGLRLRRRQQGALPDGPNRPMRREARRPCKNRLYLPGLAAERRGL